MKKEVRNPNAYNSAYESEAPGEIYFDIFKLIGFFLILVVGYIKYSGNEEAFHKYMTFKTIKGNGAAREGGKNNEEL